MGWWQLENYTGLGWAGWSKRLTRVGRTREHPGCRRKVASWSIAWAIRESRGNLRLQRRRLPLQGNSARDWRGIIFLGKATALATNCQVNCDYSCRGGAMKRAWRARGCGAHRVGLLEHDWCACRRRRAAAAGRTEAPPWWLAALHPPPEPNRWEIVK